MKLIIDIPKGLYISVIDGQSSECTKSLADAFKNGVVLPKGHGDLKDMGNLQYVFDLTREDSIYSGKDIARAIKSMTTIIESDIENGVKE